MGCGHSQSLTSDESLPIEQVVDIQTYTSKNLHRYNWISNNQIINTVETVKQQYKRWTMDMNPVNEPPLFIQILQVMYQQFLKKGTLTPGVIRYTITTLGLSLYINNYHGNLIDEFELSILRTRFYQLIIEYALMEAEVMTPIAPPPYPSAPTLPTESLGQVKSLTV